MNKLHVIGGLLSVCAAVACRPIGPPDSHLRPQRPMPGAVSTTIANPANPTISPTNPETTAAAIPTPVTPPGQTSTRPSSTPPNSPALPQASKPASPKDPYITAQKAPNKPGYVLSPHTGKLVLVDGIPSGVVVPDQTCPPGEKKFFRVP